MPYKRRIDDDFSEIVYSNAASQEMMSAIGEREGMGTTAQGEDVWRGNDLTPAPTSHTTIPTPADAGEQMTFVSEDAGDDGVGTAGTGVQTLRMHYLDANGDQRTEDITLNGTTEVDTVATDIRFVQDLYTLTVGSNGVAEGHIKVYKKGSVGLVYNMIAAGGNKSLVPHRMIPVGKSLILRGWHAEEAQNKRAAFRIRSTDMYGTLIPGVFCFKGVSYLKQASSGERALFHRIPALSIVKVSAWPDVSGSDGSCGWWGVLVKDL